MSTAALEPHVDLRRTRLETMLKVLDVDGAVRRVQGGWVATGQPWAYDADRYARVDATRSAEQQAMLEYAATDRCRMQFLREQLDDPGAAPCGRCDTCRGVPVPGEVSEASLAAAQEALGRAGVEVEPRRMWPTGMHEVKGRIPTPHEPGRALGRLSDVGWGNRLRELLAGPDAEVPDDVVRGVVAVLAQWQWAERPVAVVAVPSRSRPRLVRSLARRISELGRLPLLGELDRVREGAGGINSAQRLRQVHGAFRVPFAVPTGPLLLVDDRTDTGWTLTEATRVLREAGSGPVLPLVLALEG